MTQGRIFTGDEVTTSETIDCDVCVVGSGSGGAWVAHELTRAGHRVVMLEEGGYHTRREFDMTEARAYPNLYQELGNRTTDDLSLTILQGRSVGGGTTVNWCSSFRTPERILNIWKDRFGIDTLSAQSLAPHFDAVEKRLRIAEWPEALMNANNRVLWDGCGKLNYDRGLIKRNVHGCLNLGSCGHGCPVDAKQSMLVTTIPDAVEQGMILYANASVRELEWRSREVHVAHVEMLDPTTNRPTGVTLKVKAKVFISSCGAINTPGLLLRSGLDADGRVGTRTWFHPVAIMMAHFDTPVEAFSGAPQSVYSHQFIDRGPKEIGFFLEVPPVHPMLAAVVGTGDGAQTQDSLARLRNLNAMIALQVDGLLEHELGGTVRLKSSGYSRYSIQYDFSPELWDSIRISCKEMAKIQFAAGAKEVRSLHLKPVTLKSVADIDQLDAAPWEPVAVKIATAHQMGGCSMGKDPERSVVDPHLKFHTLDNLFVVDGSVLPTGLGVNPQETIFGIARWAAQHIGQAIH